ncbi:DUF7408 domain-containing protein [Desulforamulus hydrothermalis]|uniref:Transmembrane protein n=1 Tax=Desulforamulus hydrothermalis Lam5 = DSM 18033 TaxID=1121428 RepID=K8DXV4_9FIRM|nr:hypothetical protein [Desulforamulus hydrothermalis]CCO07435.1 conserved membrane hypothetical protein [Desulforamulus hydrothermalis Lam5 = DSM 18033]SHH18523.1 hypothetical protein SAMN02745177_01759 [Desulforamulus hydrothermalis Lam5 = DSM 18033]
MSLVAKRQMSSIMIMGLLLSWTGLLVSLLQPAAAAAGEQAPVRIAVQPGLSGIYKLGLPVGLTVTVANRGKAFNGLLVVEPTDKYPEQTKQYTRYQKTIKVPAGGLLTTTLVVPSELINEEARLVLLVDGKPVAAGLIQGTAVNGGFIALSLGEKPLQGGLSAWLDQTFGGQTAIKYMPPDYLPQDPLELSLADIIIVDDVATARLSDRQVGLLKDWVALGGMLLISGGAGTYPGGPLAEISPVTAAGRQVVAADLGGLRIVKGSMEVITGSLTQGEVLARVNGVIVVAARDYGKGRVVYSGIPLENLTSESAAFWPLVFGQLSGPNSLDAKMQTAREKRMYNNDMLGHAATYLPQFKMPPVPRVAVAWGAYIVVIGPGLYLLLKRYDRRDWLWWLIPAGAVVSTLVVYFMSPAQRVHVPISQTLAVIEIMDGNKAEVNATAAFVTPSGGTLNIESVPGAVLWPSSTYFARQKQPIIQYSEAAPRISFPDVEYWSLRQARATALKKDIGSLSGSLIIENGYLKGKITNRTSLNLRDCRILLGGRAIEIDRLPAGGSVEVNHSLAKGPGGLGPNEFRDLLVPPAVPGRSDIYIRERQMVDMVLGPRLQDYGSEPVFYGWSEDSLGMFKILGQEKAYNYNLVLVTQELPLQFPADKAITLPNDMYFPRVVESSGAFSQTPLGYTLYEGKLILEINLQRPLPKHDLKAVALEFLPRENQNLARQIYDWQENKWQDIPEAGDRIDLAEFKRFVAPTGECRFKLEKIAGFGKPDRAELPVLTVEGVRSR